MSKSGWREIKGLISLILVSLLLVGYKVYSHRMPGNTKQIPSRLTVVVPDLVMLPLEKARTVLQLKGLSIASITWVSVDQPPGLVIHSEPEGGVRVPKGSGIVLTVSRKKFE